MVEELALVVRGLAALKSSSCVVTAFEVALKQPLGFLPVDLQKEQGEGSGTRDMMLVPQGSYINVFSHYLSH